VAAALTGLLLVGAPVASALVAVRGHVRVEVPVRAPLVEFYDYGTGIPVAWTTRADFEAGTLVSLDASGDALALAGGAGPPWWNPSWMGRGCYSIDHGAPGASSVTEYPLRLELDTASLIAAGELQADGADLRAIASDATTELPLWLEGPVGAEDAAVWVQVDAIPAGATTGFCLYRGNPSAPPVSDAAAVFTYSSEKPLYATVTDHNAASTAFTVVSLVKGNRITNGVSTSPTRNEGSPHTFPAGEQTAATVFSARGPVTSRGIGDGQDTLVPLSWAATEFVVPTQRGTQHFSVYAPYADAVVTIYDGSALRAGPFTVPAGTTTSLDADVTGANSGIVVSDVPVLLFHTAGGADAFAVPPPSRDPVFGVRSTTTRIGFSAAALGTLSRSDGSGAPLSGSRGSTVVDVGGGTQGGGPADGLRMSADAAVGALQQDDGDGSESTALLPRDELGSDYYLPTDAEYVAVACPQSGVTVTVDPPGGGKGGAPVDILCAGASGGPGWAKRTAPLPAATRVFSPAGEPFLALYEDAATGDETNLLGLSQGRQYTWPEPSVTPAPDGGYAPAGTWESATFDTGAPGVFGTLAFTADMPAGTAVRLQVATGPTDPPTEFVGPDGTAATWFIPSEEALAFVHDGNRYLRLRAELTTSDGSATPRLDIVTVIHSLARFVHDAGQADVASVPGASGSEQRHWIARVRTSASALAGSTATLSLDSVSGLPFVTLAGISTTAPLVQAVTIASGVVTQSSGPPVPFEATLPHSIVLDGQTTGPAAITLLWRLDAAASGTPVVDHRLRIEVVP
jgi:hypothetical protein